MALVYLARNKITGEEYVGATTQTLNNRKLNHWTDADLGRRGSLLDALRTFGRAAIEWTTLHSCDSFQLALDLEAIEIEERKPAYNKTKGGTVGLPKGSVVTRTSDHNLKISKALTGRSISEETRANIAAARRAVVARKKGL